MIFLTFVGNHDVVDVSKDGFGAVLTTFLQYRKEISTVYVFVTAGRKTDSVDYHEIALQNKSFMEAENPDVQVKLVQIELDNPVDFDLVYPKLLLQTQKLLQKEQIQEEDKIINITSGTPTMTACWVLLHKSGLVPKSKLIQSFETRYARKRGKNTQEVNLEIENFPKITAPEELRIQLDLAQRENRALREQLTTSELDQRIPELIGRSQQIRDIKEQIVMDLDGETHVLILGERGTGKEIVASAIWRLYHRDNDTKLTTLNCSTVPQTLVVSELFGYEKGTFTGAVDNKRGLLTACDGKMVFLDEIGNMPIEGQQVLLRYVENGELRQLGSNIVTHVKTQIIAATNKNVRDSGLFAQDLRDRFHEIIELPPLRERREDIPLLVEHFVRVYSKRRKLSTPLTLKSDVMKQLQQRDWPGNVRTLERWVWKLTKHFDGGELSLRSLPPRLIRSLMGEEDTDFDLPDLPLPIPLKDYVEKIRDKARAQGGGNMSEVDRLLKQKSGTEKQMGYRRKQKNLSRRSITKMKKEKWATDIKNG